MTTTNPVSSNNAPSALASNTAAQGVITVPSNTNTPAITATQDDCSCGITAILESRKVKPGTAMVQSQVSANKIYSRIQA